MNTGTIEPIAVDVLLAYWQGELPPAEAEAIEERLFTDPETERRLQAVARLAHGVSSLGPHAGFPFGATAPMVEGAIQAGRVIRTYALHPGQTVNCTVAPDDEFVVVRLAGNFDTRDRLDLEVSSELAGAEPRLERIADVLADIDAGEVLAVYSGDVVRTFPRSRFVIRLLATRDGTTRLVGEYTMNHSPNPG